MSALFRRSRPTMCAATRNATSSPESGAGPTRSNSPDGPMTDLFGQALAPANHSLLRGSTEATPTSDTSGPPGLLSLASAVLAQCLASRLARGLGSAGGTLWRWTWNQKRTRLGRAYWEHIASVRPTSASDSTSWQTPRATDAIGAASTRIANAEKGSGPRQLREQANLAYWPTPKVAPGDYQYSSGDHTKRVLNLSGVAQLASWQMPKTPTGGGMVMSPWGRATASGFAA
jgi:hypothetical protein